MLVTATQIEQWADTTAARALLPILLRKLINATIGCTSLTMVGGDSVSVPGFDGELYGSSGNQWVPLGDSKWEMGCSADILKKANADFEKRSRAERAAQNCNQNFVFVTPRRWAGKTKWLGIKNSLAIWAGVSVIDADGLEAWLESAPSVALWFAEQLGLTGAGVDSIEKSFERWSTQSIHAVTITALLTSRLQMAERLFKFIQLKQHPFITVQADSRQEAAAFVCAVLIHNGLASQSLCITQTEGLRFVSQNPQIKVVVIAVDSSEETKPTEHEGVVFIDLACQGDISTHKKHCNSSDGLLVLNRPLASDFEQALVALGEDSNDASRLARQTGRSWSVYRRLKSKNSQDTKPDWLASEYSDCLATIMLVGGWDSGSASDRSFVQSVSGLSEEVLEKQLLYLAQLNDAPVLHIGTVWKAKSPLDLCYLLMRQFVTSTQIKRFFECALATLGKPNPVLELEPEKRFMAAIHKKIRGESGVLLSGLTDSIAKLGVYAEEENLAHADSVKVQVNSLIQSLLKNADEQRWLSMSEFLRDFAEAAPDVFLDALESSLPQKNPPVRALFTESLHESFFNSACWYANLLWALEALAWSPARMTRVANVLAQMCDFPIKNNQVDAPFKSLVSLYRYWFSQVSANTQQKQTSLERVIRNNTKIAWKLLLKLLPSSHGSPLQNARPHWRDDDAGQIVDSSQTVEAYVAFIANKTIELAAQDSQKLAELISMSDSFSHLEVNEILSHADKFCSFDDVSREELRTAMRTYLHWQNTHNQDGSKRSRYVAEKMMPIYVSLEPSDAVIANQWLFKDAWIQPAEGFKCNFEEKAEITQHRRTAALELIHLTQGFNGGDRLMQTINNVWRVGFSYTQTSLPECDVLEWAWQHFVKDGAPHNHKLLSSVFSGYGTKRALVFIGKTVQGDEFYSAVLSCLRFDSNALDFVRAANTTVQKLFWNNFQNQYDDLNDKEQALVVDSLMSVDRYCSAFDMAHSGDYTFNKTLPDVLMRLLLGVSSVEEPNRAVPSQSHIAQAFIRLSESKAIPSDQLAALEFSFFKALEYSEYPAKTLYDELLKKPDFFIQLICMCYKSNDEATREAANQSAIEIAYAVLNKGRCIPGQQADQTVNANEFTSWVNAVREQGKEKNCLDVIDITLGQWFSACPPDEDDTWPCLVIRDFLEQENAEILRRHFHMGVYNNRGVTSHGAFEGGEQERVLEDKYKGHAALIELTHPMVATTLRNIAKSYRWNAKRNDDEALLRMEH